MSVSPINFRKKKNLLNLTIQPQIWKMSNRNNNNAPLNCEFIDCGRINTTLFITSTAQVKMLCDNNRPQTNSRLRFFLVCVDFMKINDKLQLNNKRRRGVGCIDVYLEWILYVWFLAPSLSRTQFSFHCNRLHRSSQIEKGNINITYLYAYTDDIGDTHTACMHSQHYYV